jgi:hypothetical protein
LLPPIARRSSSAGGGEGLYPLEVAGGYLRDRGLAVELPAVQAGNRIPERGSADGKADEASYRRRRLQPGGDTRVIGAAA